MKNDSETLLTEIISPRSHPSISYCSFSTFDFVSQQIVDLTEMVRSTKAERDGLSNLVIGMQKLLAPALQDEEKMSLLPSNSYNNNIEIPPGTLISLIVSLSLISFGV